MSDYKSLLQRVVNTAVTGTLNSLSSTVVFQSVVDEAYDPVSGKQAQRVTSYPCACIQVKVQQTDTPDVTMISNGKKLLVPSSQLPGIDVNALDDSVLLDGVDYTIKSVKTDPAGALYSFLVVASSGILSGAVHK